MTLAEPLHVGGVYITEVDLPSLSDADVRALHTFMNVMRAEAFPEDPPVPLELTEAEVRNIPEFMARRDFWARNADGVLVAGAAAIWTRSDDNKHVLQARINVLPDHRRQGMAKALLGIIADVAEAESRPLLMATTRDRAGVGEAFARRVGADAAIATHINRLRLSDVDRSMVDRWIDEGPSRAPGYSLIAVDGPYPDDLVEEIIEVEMVMNTAPRDDLDVEDETWTVEQARAGERSMLAAGTERWSLYARHDASGELVGFTEVGWNDKQPQTVWQWGTGVKPDHRGHALGKWLKAVMLRRIFDERPTVVEVQTGNADSNDAMLGINRALGFKPYVAETGWQARLDRVREYLSS